MAVTLSRFLKITLAVVVSVAAMLPSFAKADFVYTYTGNPFQVTYRVVTQFSETYWDLVEYNYSVSLNVIARSAQYLTKNSTVDDLISLKFSANNIGLGAADVIYPGAPPTPADYNPQVGGYLNFNDFDINGLPASWAVGVNQYAFYGGRGHYVYMTTSNNGDSLGGYDEPFVSFDGSQNGQSGSWQLTSSFVPEPKIFWLILWGLGVMGFAFLRRNRKMSSSIILNYS